jgi:hypothetical protein
VPWCLHFIPVKAKEATMQGSTNSQPPVSSLWFQEREDLHISRRKEKGMCPGFHKIIFYVTLGNILCTNFRSGLLLNSILRNPRNGLSLTESFMLLISWNIMKNSGLILSLVKYFWRSKLIDLHYFKYFHIHLNMSLSQIFFCKSFVLKMINSCSTK